MKRIGEHAVVIGGSMAGLLAARSLTEAYERVTVSSATRCPPACRPAGRCRRAATPHALLPRGQACLDALLPGLQRRAGRRRGAEPARRWRRCGSCSAAISSPAHRRAPARILASRPFIEGHVRRRVRALPQVDAASMAATLLGLTASRDGERVDRRADPPPGRRQRRGDARRPISSSPPPAARPASPPGSRRSATRPPGGAPRRRRHLRQPAACRCPPTRSTATSSC